MMERESRKRKDSLLILISELGGECTIAQMNEKVPEYWELRKEELEIEEGTRKPLYWHHVASVRQGLKDKDGYLENPERGVWKVTKEGEEYLKKSIGHGPRPITHVPLIEEEPVGKELPVCKELRESQRNSDNPTIFEKVLVDAFNKLGFSAKHIGGRDEPDIFINGNFNIILDSKTTKEGVITERYINFDAMDRYKERENYRAEYIGVVAPGFSGGYIRETSKKRGITLIETEAICSILQNHVTYPYEPNHIVEILFKSDKDVITPMDIPPSTIDQEKLIEIVAKILSDIKLTGKTSFSSQELHIAYSWYGLDYESDDIKNALKFLSVAPFNILQKQNDKFSLTGNIESILKKIGLLLQAFNIFNRIGR